MKFIRWCTFATLCLVTVHETVLALTSSLTVKSHRRTRSATRSSKVLQATKHVDCREYTTTLLSRKAFLRAASLLSVISAAPLPSQAAVPALSFNKDRRQLELCLVAVWRVVYWAEALANDLANPSLPLDTRKLRYLEARLAAKSMLTGKIGGGANLKVYTLSTLQIPGCLEDLSEAYNKDVSETSRELYESIASLVEFDGMDTLTDPSPRSSLTLTQFDSQKETFVRRILTEKIVPLGKKIINSFPEEIVATSQRYIQQNYASEVFPQPAVDDETSTTA